MAEIESSNVEVINKARFWCAVLYPENMVADWQERISDILQLPFAYCVHDKDRDSKSDYRKDHVHIIVVFPNTTTYKHAMKVLNQLSSEGHQALNTCRAVVGIRNMYDYLIHDTEACRKAGKEMYSPGQRITGNNFDIGSYEQIGVAERNRITKELCDIIVNNCIDNFADFYELVVSQYSEDSNYLDMLYTRSGLFERMTRAVWYKYQYHDEHDSGSGKNGSRL